MRLRRFTPVVTSRMTVRLGLPKGRMQEGVFSLLRDAGLPLRSGSREYRPRLGVAGFEAKIQKPQNIVEMLHTGTRDAGFAGHDWVQELCADVVEVLDTGLDRVTMVAAAPAEVLVDGKLPNRPLVVASEYERLTQEWLARRAQGDRFVRSYGATEVFPPEDADCIVDITATGATLAANGLHVVEELGVSSTRLYASREAWSDPVRKDRIEELAMLVRSVIEARARVMLELNVSAADLGAVIAVLPCMREPTVSTLHADQGFAVKAAVPRSELPVLVPQIKRAGGTDIVVTELRQVVP
jgi:ATP phosphoribosyltransferase